METTTAIANYLTSHTAAGAGPHHLMLGTVVASKLLGGDTTDGQLSVVELVGAPGSGPGPHLDPWRETFYVLDGELTFRVEEHEAVRTIVARRGDSVSIPRGVGHAFSATSAKPTRYLIASTPAGIDAFFADAGAPVATPRLPAASPSPAFDRDRLLAAFQKHGLSPYEFPGDEPVQGGCAR